jgi:hypothetical protein
MNNVLKNKLILIITLIVLIISCSEKKTNETKEEEIVVKESNAIQYNYIEKQFHKINSKRDTILYCMNGSIIELGANIFSDSLNKPITGTVELEIIEALTPDQILLANLTTTSNGKILETDGMIYINALQGKTSLKIKDSASISITIPTDSVVRDMKFYEGMEDTKCINWINPKKILEPKQENENPIVVDAKIIVEEFDSEIKRHNVAFQILDDDFKDNEILKSKISEIIWADNGLIITKDSLITVDNHNVKLWKQKDFFEWNKNKVSYISQPIKGTNTFQQDEKTNYVFSLKKLGWANIDRLFNDPRTQEVNFITTISNSADFDRVNITLIFNSKSIFLPGYQKEDNTYCFSHNDQEKQNLPINESAKIFAVAYKNDMPYYSIYDFTIQKNQNIELTLVKTSLENLKKELESKI